MRSDFKILLKTFLTLEFRDKENSGKKKFFGIFISYLFANSVLSVNNYFAFNKESYIILSFSTGVFLLVFVILNDFGNLLFAKRHLDIFNTLPLTDSEILLSKFISALIYFSVYAIIIVLPQALFFSLYNGDVTELILFTLADGFSLFCITGLILFIYTISYGLFSKKSNIILYLLQFIFFFYVIAVSSFASRYAMQKTDIFTYGFVKYLPQFYFANSIDKPAVLILLILATVLVYVAYFYYLKKNYRKISSLIFDIKEAAERKKIRFNFFRKYNELIGRWFVKDNEENASYFLTLNQLGNSRTLKLKFIPLTFLPLVVAVIALFSDSYKFISNTGEGSSVLILSPSISFVIIMCSRLLISATKIEDENSPNVKWVYSTLPILSIKKVQSANINFIFINFILPVSIFLFLILSFKFPAYHLLLNMLYLLSASYMINLIFLLSDKIYPYTMENTKHNSASKLGEILFIMLIGVALFITQIFIFENVIFVIISILLFLIISFLLKHKSFSIKTIN